MLFGYCVWPAAHVINFRYVPSDLRVLYINCVQVHSKPETMFSAMQLHHRMVA